MPNNSNSGDPSAADIPLDDVVLVQRKLLLKGEPKAELQRGIPRTPYPVYPYTKGSTWSNDGIGYGEGLRMTVCVKVGGQMRECFGYGRRTRTGRQVVTDGDLHVKQWMKATAPTEDATVAQATAPESSTS